MIPSNTHYDWRIDIIRKHVKIGEARVKSCTVDFVEDAEVTRTMKAQIPRDGFKLEGIRIKQDEDIIYFDGTRVFDGSWCFTSVTGKWLEVENTFDMFSDRLRPVMVVDGTEYDFGDYMVIAAPLEDDGKEYLYDIEAYDETMTLKQAALTERKYYAAGTPYLNIIGSMLSDCGLSKVIEDPTDAEITIDHEYAIGTPYLEIINELLDEINYSHIYAGRSGYIYLTQNGTKTTADYVYTDDNSTIVDSISTDTDIYSLPNVVVGYVSSPDIPTVMKYKRVNDNPKSVISTVRRGYNVVESFELNDCPDLQTLQLAVDNKFLESTQATETAKITTMPDDNHPYGSYISLGQNGENTLFREVGWSIEFGGKMSHDLERKAFV
jgi:hypothetical protein